MANKVHAVVNGFNERAKFYGQPDRLTTQDIFAVLEFYNRKSCKSQLPTTHIDHVIPLSQGGQNTRANLQLLTESENKQKGDSTADYRNNLICPDDFIPQESQDYNYNNDVDAQGEGTDSQGNKPKNQNGGRRPGAGRKPTEYTILKQRIKEQKIVDAEKAFDLYVQVMENHNEETAMRLAAADRVLDRVLGKPATMAPNAGDDLFKQYAKLAQAFVLGDNGLQSPRIAEGFESVFNRIQAAASTDTDPLVA